MISVIYDKFVEDYNNPNLTVDDVRRKHCLNSKRYLEIRQIALENKDIPIVRKMNRTDAKFYTKTDNGFVVKKQFGNDCLFVGRFADEETAKLVVNKCKEVNWNVSEISEFIDRHKVKPANYSYSNGQYTVQKVIGGKNRVICTVNTEETAQKLVEKFRECNWNKEEMHKILGMIE